MTMDDTNKLSFRVGGKYNWKGQSERLVYIGRNWSGNGYWHQFELVGKPGIVWCEVPGSDDLSSFEESKPADTPPVALPAVVDAEAVRDPEDELNCAEEVLDGIAAHLPMKQTAFDCMGDYIAAVFEAAASSPPAAWLANIALDGYRTDDERRAAKTLMGIVPADNERELGLGYETGASEIERLQADLVSIRSAWNKAEEELATARAALSKLASEGDGEAVSAGFWLAPMEVDGPMTTAYWDSVEAMTGAPTVLQARWAALRDSWLARHPQTLVHADVESDFTEPSRAELRRLANKLASMARVVSRGVDLDDFDAHTLNTAAVALELSSRHQQTPLHRDAARYRWIRDEAVWRADPDGRGEMLWAVVGTRHDDCTPIDGAELDAAVDERLDMASKPSTGESNG